MIWLFWISFGILVYHLIGYPMILALLSIGKREKRVEVTQYPRITVLCPAYNEADVIERKIKSFHELDYPKDRIDMIVISDDSTDGTNEIVERYTGTNVSLVVQKPRQGKVAGHNLVEPTLKCDFVVSTDANSIFHPQAMKELLSSMLASDRIGVVGGKLTLEKNNQADSGEGVYWEYESFLKKISSKVYTINCANGSIFMIRRNLFKQLPVSAIDDFERTLMALKAGYIGKFNDRARVTEKTTTKPREEFSRKVRIISREWKSLFRHPSLLNPFKFPAVSWILISHKVIRWLFFLYVIGMTISLNVVFVSSLMNGFSSLWQWFYSLFAVGLDIILLTGSFEFHLENRGNGVKIFKPAAYFFTMFYASLMAFVSYLRGKANPMWKTVR